MEADGNDAAERQKMRGAGTRVSGGACTSGMISQGLERIGEQPQACSIYASPRH